MTEGTDDDMIPANVLEMEISSIGILRNYAVPFRLGILCAKDLRPVLARVRG